jgi:pyrroloquinoline quinone (PQQ) biosynthesis protein C
MKTNEEIAVQFFDSLQLATAGPRAELFAAPLIRECLAGRITRVQYLGFLAEAYHHVKHTVPLMMACGSRLSAAQSWLRDPVAKYIDEELGHEQWILDDIEAAGGDAERVRTGTPKPATELMVAYVYDYIARRNPVGFFGMVQVLEGTSTAIATKAAAAIESALGLSATATRYLRSHGEVDVSHVRFLADLMNRLESSDDQSAVLHVATMVYRLYRDVFLSVSAIDEQPMAKAAT